MRLLKATVLFTACCLISTWAVANTGLSHVRRARISSHAPMGRKLTIGLTYMHMSMDGKLHGRRSINKAGVFARGYRVSPRNMTMNSVMLNMAYMFTKRFQLMAMLPYLQKNMRLVTSPTMMTAPNQSFSMSSSGIGDATVLGRYVVLPNLKHHFFFDVGFNVPTGSINKKGKNVMGKDVLLPYPMQLGTGKTAFVAGATYGYHVKAWLYTLDAHVVIQLGKNANHYAIGNAYSLIGHIRRHLTAWAAVSAGLEVADQGRIRGADPQLDKTLSPTANPDAQGGTIGRALIGVHLKGRHGWLKQQQFDVELGLPVYQRVNSIQLKQTWEAVVFWKIHIN